MHLLMNISSGGCVAVPCGAFLEPEQLDLIKIAGLSAAAGLLAGHRDPITGPLGGKVIIQGAHNSILKTVWLHR